MTNINHSNDVGIVVPQHYVPRWYQLEVQRARAQGYKRTLKLWHRKTGKDLDDLVTMFMEMMKRVGVYYYFFPSYAQGRKALWENTCEDGIRFLDRMPKELIKSIRNNEMYMELKNGSIFRVVGADKNKVDDLVGAGPIGITMSEYGIGKDYQIVLDLFMPVLMQNGGFLNINGTPRGKNHYWDLWKRALTMPEEWFVSSLQTISPDFDTGKYTGLITPEQLGIVYDQGTDKEIILQEYGVSFTAGVRGSVFGPKIEKAYSENRIRELEIDDQLWVETFFDIGSNDMTAIWFMQRVGNKRLWIDYYQDSNKDAAFYVEVMKNKGYRYRFHHLPHDARNRYVLMPQLSPVKIVRDAVKESGIGGAVKSHTRPTNRWTLINHCKKMFSHYYFDSGRCKEAIRLVESFHRKYDPIRRVYMNETVHDESSHCCDALMLEAVVKHQDTFEAEQSRIKELTTQRRSKPRSVLDRFSVYRGS